jgi:hypothetical protein
MGKHSFPGNPPMHGRNKRFGCITALTALVAGGILALGATSAAQAAPLPVHHNSKNIDCSAIYEMNNEYYGVWFFGLVNFQWETNESDELQYCMVGSNKSQIEWNSSCIELDSSTGGLHLGTTASCDDDPSYSEWNFVPTGGGGYEYRSWYGPGNFCILAQPSGDTVAYATCNAASGPVEFYFFSNGPNPI